MRLSPYQKRLTFIISLVITFLWPSAVAGEEDDILDQRVKRWCERLHIYDSSSCIDRFAGWCQDHKDSKNRPHQCEKLESARKISPTTQLTTTDLSLTTAATETSQVPQIANQNDKQSEAVKPFKARVAQKVSKNKLNGLKGLLNQAAQGLAANVKKLVELGDVFALKPPPKALASHTELAVNDPELYYEGDVDLTPPQFDQIFKAIQLASNVLGRLSGRRKRKVSKAPHYQRWPQPDRIPIPYQFDDSVPQDTRDIIDRAVQLWQDNTCVRWRKNGPGNDRVEFYDGPGCSSFVGRAGGVQQISLHTPGCDTVG